ncbi:MFS transporter [Gammaproteobacteria bacterium]|nr:MFS transporter [Gammaproteobacteria bacterium]MDA8857633.1 MFS transporter [Gammaproteobacteria bacterium]MDA8908397.1 MFS transporter [Gammaproteobacteria bacterium]MDA8999485.1 MFS transporter [Gammaproteobacteria bacterium]MDA9932534.1 MFS transporter [Gammaproteobacteria bacterium]
MNNKKLPSKNYRAFALVLLTVVYGFNFIDRQIVGILAPFIQEDLGLSNTQLGLLIGFAFALFYTVIAIPIAWLADRYNRVNILSIALATWSGFTALTGMATNFWQIGLARMGVGIGEAGGSPPSHSIISDMYSKEERAGALGVYAMGIPFGIMAAYFATASLMGSGGDVDWRRIFIFLGLTGIALAGLVRLTLREPSRGAMELDDDVQIAKLPFIESLRSLLKIPAWWAMCFGIAFGSFVSYASSAFQTKFLIALDPSFDFKTMVILLGIMNGTTYAGGAFFGARLADKWGAKNLRAYGWLPAIAMSVTLPLGIWSYWVQSVEANLILSTIYLLFIGIYLGPSFAIAQTLAPINMRAMSTALFFFILNMVALGGGPTFAGWLIDVYKETYSDLDAMRMAMTVTHLVFIPALISFLIVSRILPRDWKLAEKRNQELASNE